MVKKIKLRKHNSVKYCLTCDCFVEVEMRGLDGHCSICKTKLYSVDTRGGERK